MVKLPEETKEEVQPDRSYSRRGASRTSSQESGRPKEDYDIEEGRPMSGDGGGSGRGGSLSRRLRGRSLGRRGGSGKQDDSSEGGGGSSRRRALSGNKARKRGSSRIRTFLTRMGESFRRSQGNRGASVEILRGSRGAEFEGQARVIRGEAWGSCFTFCTQEDDDELAEKHLLIKGPFCFVFYEDDDLSPRYAIPLEKMKGIVRDTIKDVTVVTLERKGEVEYEISFDSINLAKEFRDAVAKQAAGVRAENYAKKRGTNGPLKHTSVRYAEAVARLKVDMQPEKEEQLTTEDMLDSTF